ncbi:hypothetical protein PR048_017067 [Dryococelus australis]|uniref:Uncharacterized protein n=1 Tax=Dryococelus australis TaxID=614101 RepID=A0ABQ9H8J0_9NEOP|nr:hypothetical protein PR048_017067 [Dryococelus australis]
MGFEPNVPPCSVVYVVAGGSGGVRKEEETIVPRVALDTTPYFKRASPLVVYAVVAFDAGRPEGAQISTPTPLLRRLLEKYAGWARDSPATYWLRGEGRVVKRLRGEDKTEAWSSVEELPSPSVLGIIANAVFYVWVDNNGPHHTGQRANNHLCAVSWPRAKLGRKMFWRLLFCGGPPCRSRLSNTVMKVLEDELVAQLRAAVYSLQHVPRVFERVRQPGARRCKACIKAEVGSCGVVVVRPLVLLASHLCEPGLIPGGVKPGLLHFGMVADDVTVWRVLSGISCFPRPYIPMLLHTHLASPRCHLQQKLLCSVTRENRTVRRVFFCALKHYDKEHMQFTEGDILKNHAKNCKDSHFESQQMMSPIPSATSIGTDSTDDCNVIVDTSDVMRDLRC